MFAVINPKNYVADAKRNSPTHCPLALAINDFLKSYITYTEVLGNKVIYHYYSGEIWEGEIDEKLSQAVKHFDETGEWVYELPVIGSTDGIGKNNIQGTYKREAV